MRLLVLSTLLGLCLTCYAAESYSLSICYGAAAGLGCFQINITLIRAANE